MKAVRIHEFGGPEVLRYEDVPDPKPRKDQVLVRVRACALNHLDIWVRKGLPGVNLPHILGSDIAGEVVAVGELCERVQPGCVYVAPPNRHLLVNPDHRLSLTQTQLVHFVRPSADLLFESTAASFKERAIAVVLSGSGHDGAMGVTAIHKMGGTVIVQDAKSAEFTGMPEAAAATGVADFVLALDEIAPALLKLCAATHH